VKIKVYPADTTGCGFFRLIWPVEYLRRKGLLPADVQLEIRPPQDRDLKLRTDGERVVEVLDVEPDAVYVFQRLTHSWMAQAVPLLRAAGAAVVVDVDDDLGSIHPRNPAYHAMHPSRFNRWDQARREINRHSWRCLADACRDATLVTVSTPALLERYAGHGRGHVLYNYLPDVYYGLPHEDSDVTGWPAALHSHPDDPSAVGGAVARLVAEGAAFRVVGDPVGTGAAFGLPADAQGVRQSIPVMDWPAAVASLGIGIAPLADTRFNACKSWLKPLEMSALGVPWVASPRAEYRRLAERAGIEERGTLADNPRRWHRELDRLRRDPALRAERSEAGRAVAETLRLRDHAWRWLEAWSRARDIQNGAAMRPADSGAVR
jgi:hypothetical protein